MIEILKIDKEKQKLKIIKKYEKNSWINIVNPDLKEIKALSKLINIKKNDFEEFKEEIESLQDMEEIPIIDKLNNLTFIIHRTPQKRTNNNIEYFTVPLGLLITKHNIITFCYRKNDVIEKIKNKKILNFKKIKFVLDLLLVSSRTYLNHLKEIDRKIQKIESKLEKAQKNKQIMRLLDLKKSLVYFNTSLKNDEILLERLSRTKQFISNSQNIEFIEDVIDENKQAIEMTSIYSNIIRDTLEVFSSVISNNLNRVMKFLTSITLIIALPTLISGIYGMNVNLPLQNNLYAFFIIICFSILLCLAAIYILIKKKMF